jgi:TetR/AcrR family transcriptional regulator
MPDAVAENGFQATTVEDIVRLAQVRRNAFYEQFEDKHDCFAAVYEIAQERLLGVLTLRCYTHSGLEQRVGAAISAGLGFLEENPATARFLFVEAPAAGQEISVRHHEWLDRYGRLLRLATVGSPDVSSPRAGVEPAIVGAVVSRIKQRVLAGAAGELSGLAPELVQLVLGFYGKAEPPVELEPADDSPAGAVSVQPQSPDSPPVLEPV